MRHHVRVRLDLLEEAELLQPRDDLLARREAVEAVKLVDELRGAFRQPRNSPRCRQREPAFDVEDVDQRQVVALADLEVVEVVRRRDLHRAGALLGIGIVVGDDRDQAADERQDARACRSDAL